MSARGGIHRVGRMALVAFGVLAGCLALGAGTAVAAPAVSTSAATAVGVTSATLAGVVNPEGEAVTSCQFEYGTSTEYGRSAACVPAAPGAGSSPVAVSAEVSGLAAGTTYHYRLVAGDANGLSAGVDESVTTLPAVAEVQTEEAGGVEQQPAFGAFVATLNGSLAPDGFDTHYYFEYGETEAYGSVSPAPPGTDAGSASEVEHARALIGGLKGDTTYHFRIVAANSLGTTPGADMTFTTPTKVFAAPAIGAVPASGVSQFAATLNATLQTGEAIVNYRFEYGATTAYGQVAPVPDEYAPITTATVPIAQPVEGLQAGTTYHYRLVASSPGGTEIEGPDETFTTLPIPAPEALTGASAGVGVGSATLSGTVDPHGWDTSYSFQYGTSTAYGSSWPTVPVAMGALEGPQPVAVYIQNLLPGTTYHYRLVASNGGGSSYGPDMTFTTGEYPVEAIQEPPTAGTLRVPNDQTAKASTKPVKKKKKGKGKRKKKGGSKGRAGRGKRAGTGTAKRTKIAKHR